MITARGARRFMNWVSPSALVNVGYCAGLHTPLARMLIPTSATTVARYWNPVIMRQPWPLCMGHRQHENSAAPDCCMTQLKDHVVFRQNLSARPMGPRRGVLRPGFYTVPAPAEESARIALSCPRRLGGTGRLLAHCRPPSLRPTNHNPAPTDTRAVFHRLRRSRLTRSARMDITVSTARARSATDPAGRTVTIHDAVRRARQRG